MTVSTESSLTNSPTPQQPTQTQKGSNFLNDRKEKERLKTISTWVTDEYKRCKSSRVSIERVWYRNLAFYLGNQWVVYKQDGINDAGKLYTPKAPPWRTRMTVNRIKPIIRTELARITSQKPNASVVPASSEDEDLFAAQAGEQVWESTYSTKKINRVFSRAAWWTLVCGNGFIKVYWDPEKVDKDSDLQGDFCVDPVTPFHIFVPDLMEEELENQVYVIHAYTRPVGQARLEYPDLWDKLKPELASSNEIMDDAMLRVGANNKPDSVLYVEMWLKPGAHKDYPNGGMIQIVGGYVVQEIKDGLPYEHGEFPFTKFDHVPTGKFYSDSVIVDLIPLQREYNRTRSQIIEAKNRMAKPQLRAPRGSIDAAKITSEPGIVIEYNPGFDRPEPMPLQPLPPYVLQELDRTVADMEDISAQHEVSRGNVPSGVTAATAISYLQERDDSVLTHTYASVEEGMEKLAKQVLALAVQYWTVERVIKVTGTDGAFDAISLKGSDLSEGTDIRMESGSALPVSKAARQAFIMDMMKMGFIDPQQGLRLMEIGGVQKLYDQLQIDERQAQRENLRMKLMPLGQIQEHNQMSQMFMMQTQQAQQEQSIVPPELQGDILGQPATPDSNFAQQQPQTDPNTVDTQTGQPLQPPDLVPVNTWDNHAVHIEVHNRFRKSQAFEMLSDDHKALFESHVQKHALALNQSAMNAQMGQPGMGQPGPNGPQQAGQTPALMDEMPPEAPASMRFSHLTKA